MTVANAIKKLSKYGEVQHGRAGQYWAVIGMARVSFIANGIDAPESSITCEHCMRVTEEHDFNSDYHAGSYFDNLSQAINSAINMNKGT